MATKKHIQWDVYKRSTGECIGHVSADGPNRARNKYLHDLGFRGRSFPDSVFDVQVKPHQQP